MAGVRKGGWESNEEVVHLTDRYVMKTYGRFPIAPVRGEGCRLWDADGKEYLDFVAGLAVCNLGHCHPRVVRAIREQAGVLLESDGLYTRLTAMQNLDYFGRISRLSASDRRQRIQDLLTAMGLWDRRDGRVADFSTGMRQKLALARAFLHRPKLLFLDEPTSGLDTPSAVALRRQLVALARDEGVTVFLTTHNLLEAEKVCDRVAVIRRGLLLAEGSPKEFHGGRSRRVSILGRGFTDSLVVRIRDLAAVEGAALESGPQGEEGVGRILVDLASGGDPAPVVRLLVEAGADVTSVESARESLEDIFLKLVEEGEEEGMIE